MGITERYAERKRETARGNVECDRCWRWAHRTEMTSTETGEQLCPHCLNDHGRACRCDECCARANGGD